MLSLSPRYDQWRFLIPDGFIPPEVLKKWEPIIKEEPGVFPDSLAYLNESITGISLPGINETIITQPQHSTNRFSAPVHQSGLGKINVEPKQDNTYIGTRNPLDLIDRTLNVSFRINQGLYNYYMMYESLFLYICKPHQFKPYDRFEISLLAEDGRIISKIILDQVIMTGLGGIEFSYEKNGRNSESFTVAFRWNNIDFDIVPSSDSIC